MKYLAAIALLCVTAVVMADEAIPASTLVTAKEELNVYSNIAKSIVLQANKPEFVIKLPANPTTGYSWFIKNYNHDLFELSKQEYQQNTHAAGMTGVGGNSFFYFKAKPMAFIGSYSNTIDFQYARPWDLSAKDAKFVTFTIATINQTGDK